jgi:acetoin utilization deacetylase AcuC-like enzyme
MRAAYIYDPSFLQHGSPTHRERPERLLAVERALAAEGLHERLERLPARPATDAELERVHLGSHVEQLTSFCAHGGGWLDDDTYASPDSEQVARLASGAAICAVDRVVRDGAPFAFVACRPPGHHATADAAMGFCLYNHVAVAARHAREVLHLERVAIVDWDVHHGNGTQAIFYDDPSVLFASLHQSPLYPGTGHASERGHGAGMGTTLNLPLPPGQGDAEYLRLMEEVVRPALLDFRPQLLLVSAGFDAHERDLLAQMQVTTAGFAAMARAVGRMARDCGAEGRLVALLEGGYDLEGLSSSVVATLQAWLDPR